MAIYGVTITFFGEVFAGIYESAQHLKNLVISFINGTHSTEKRAKVQVIKI